MNQLTSYSNTIIEVFYIHKNILTLQKHFIIYRYTALSTKKVSSLNKTAHFCI